VGMAPQFLADSLNAGHRGFIAGFGGHGEYFARGPTAAVAVLLEAGAVGPDRRRSFGVALVRCRPGTRWGTKATSGWPCPELPAS